MKKLLLVLFLLFIPLNVRAVDSYFEQGSLGETYRSMNYYYEYNGNTYLLKVDNVLVSDYFFDTNQASVSLYSVDKSGKKQSEVLLINGDSSKNNNKLQNELGISFSGSNLNDTILVEMQKEYYELSESEQEILKNDTQSSLLSPTLVFTTHNNKIVAYGDNDLNKSTGVESPLIGQLKENTTSEFVTSNADYNYNIHMEPTYVEKDQQSYKEDLEEITDYLETNCSDTSSYEENKEQCEKEMQKAGIIKDVVDESYNKYENAVDNKIEETIKQQYSDNQTISNVITQSQITTNSGNFVSIAVGCGDIYGGELGDWINNVFSFVKYAGLALVVLLTTMDFLKVVTSDKDDSLNNAFSRFVKRCIAVILLFLTPVLINFVFDLLGDNIKGSDGTVVDVCIDHIK